jgi:CheY-like chemotaxis protein
MRVLVIDDMAEMRTLISRVLSTQGHVVDLAATLGEARGLDPGGYDVLVVDDHLGLGRGTDLVASLAAADPAAAERCVVMTGGTARDLPAGVALLVKPFKPAELIEAVRAVPSRASTQAAGPTGHHPMAGPAHQEPALEVSGPHGHPDPYHGAPPGDGDGEAATVGPWQLIGLIDRLRACDHAAVADFWHDGPAQQLSAATLALQLIARSVPAERCERIDEILQWLDSVASSMRGLTQERRAPPGQAVLRDALRQQGALLLAGPLEVRTKGDLTALEPVEEAAIVTVVELLLDVIARLRPAFLGETAQVEVISDERFITIDLAVYPGPAEISGDGAPTPELAALDAVARALGGRAEASPGEVGWLARVVLRRRPAGFG